MLAELYPKQYTHIANQCDNNNNNNGTRKTNDSLPFDWNKTGIDLLMESKTEKSTEKHKNAKAQKIQKKTTKIEQQDGLDDAKHINKCFIIEIIQIPKRI